MAVRYLIPDGQHLPVSGEDGKPDHRLMGAAWAALFHNYRGKSYEGPGKEEAKAALRALYKSEGLDAPSETASADGPRIMLELGAMPESGTLRVPIIVTGSWEKTTEDGERQLVVTLPQLKSIVANFAEKLNGEINVDYDHKSEPIKRDKIAEPIPSAGRIVALAEPQPYTDRQGVKRYIIWGTYEPTPRARELVRNREYRWISAAWYSGGDDAELSTVALTNTPLMEEMPQIQLSEAGFVEVKAEGRRQKTEARNHTAAEAATKEQRMAGKNLTLMKTASGEHAVMDGDTPMGTIDHNHLKNYAAKNCADDSEMESAMAAAEARGRKAAIESFTADAGVVIEAANGKHIAKVAKGTVMLLAETVGDDGKIDRIKLAALVDSGAVKPSVMLSAVDTERRVDLAFAAGKILPAKLKAATCLALADATAFKAFVEDAAPAVDLEVRGATAVEGATGPNGDGPCAIALAEAIKKRMAANPKESFELAELNVVRTPEGLKLHEAARKERLAKAPKLISGHPVK